MGDTVSGSSVQEAMINVLEVAVQFVLEEVSLTLDDVEFVFYDRKLVGWLTGEKNVDWNHRFLRNACRARIQAPQDVKIVYELPKNFNVRNAWCKTPSFATLFLSDVAWTMMMTILRLWYENSATLLPYDTLLTVLQKRIKHSYFIRTTQEHLECSASNSKNIITPSPNHHHFHHSHLHLKPLINIFSSSSSYLKNKNDSLKRPSARLVSKLE
ncbi:hypothetical protein PIB30_081920 [Stylosanthes scabra]|uniref:Uncharacterized protein n=1 Tax=Stylosanthes scabra TaxID=79078 RepID=A0ABU6SU46_9FABA|nr:hypothetical protein [Stylosanthes scabra]